MDNGLRIVQGNTFATAIEIHAVDATGQPIVDWSLQDSTDIRVWYVFAGREVDITTWSIENGKVVILWLANQQRVGAYDIFVDGVFNGGQWRNAMQYQFSIVRFNHEANIPSNVIILDGIYQLSAEMAIITRMFDNRGTPSDTTPNMDGEAEVGTEERYARGDHRHPSDTSKQDVIADLEAIRSGAEAGATAYQKPANGIPASDLASGVIPDVSQFITKSVDDLVNYYLKSETYTKEEVQALIAAINQFHYEVYPTLASVTDPQSNVLYLIGPTGSGTDMYEEYVYANGNFVKIGDTSIDLSGYVTTQALNAALADYSTTSQMQSAISTALASYYTKQQTDTLLGGKQDTLTFDNVPTSGSDNPVKSGGVYDAIGEVDAKLADYAKIDGAYEGMLAGNAMNLVDTTGTPILREFVFSKSGGTEQIATGTALIKSLRGNTIVWNQLVQNGNFADGTTGWVGVGTTITASGGTLLAVPLDTTGTRFIAQNIVIHASHKYLYSFYITSNRDLPLVRLQFYNATTGTQEIFGYVAIQANAKTHLSGIYTATYDSTRFGILPAESGGSLTTDEYRFNNIILIDLTKMFGAGNEPTSVAEFEKLFPLDYYAYDEGSLLSFSGDSIKTVGFNQWDEEWELGAISTTDGSNVSSTTEFRSKNYIRVLPNETYYFKVGNGLNSSAMKMRYYDANKNYIGYTDKNGASNAANVTRVMPSNAGYIRFSIVDTYYGGTTYNHDICINLSDLSKNGTYEPYESHTKDISFYKSIVDGQGNTLFPYGLLSAGSVYDEVTENKAIKRIGVVDMGSLNWFYYNASYSFGAPVTGIKSPSVTSERNQGIICPKYTPDTQIALNEYRTDKTMLRYSTNIYIRDDSYNTDVSAFKTAMNGVMLYYELAEPIEVDIEEQNLAYQVDGGGTEQLLPENTSTPTTTPGRFDVNYGLDAMATLKNLQQNYLAQTDLDRLLTTMGTALGFTYTKTWDATNNQWNFTITPTNNG